jgi:hypothetical protein
MLLLLLLLLLREHVAWPLCCCCYCCIWLPLCHCEEELYAAWDADHVQDCVLGVTCDLRLTRPHMPGYKGL